MRSVVTTSIMMALTLISLLFGGCSMISRSSSIDLPPVLSQDELIRPYERLGRIQVTRETYGSDYSLPPDIRQWGFTAVRQQAEKMGADAVMLLEVTGGTTVYGLIPSTEYRASGVAIKFK
ncbi:MAG TPA: hypothetical protein HPP76_02060 [Desulfuromonadales bacterium]|nr:hypothetical protein [Desulfuromonadales bacterium]